MEADRRVSPLTNAEVRLHAKKLRDFFGLKDATKVDKVEIRWSDGTKENYTLPGVDRIYQIEEGKGIVPSVYDGIANDRATKNDNPLRTGH